MRTKERASAGEDKDNVSLQKLLAKAGTFAASVDCPDGAACVVRFLEDMSGCDGQDDTVCVSTIHAAKGREWNVVFVVQCNESVLPLTRHASSDVASALEEERRLFYVAMTRARDRLFLSCTVGMGKAGVPSEPSRFLVECGVLDSNGEGGGHPPSPRKEDRSGATLAPENLGETKVVPERTLLERIRARSDMLAVPPVQMRPTRPTLPVHLPTDEQQGFSMSAAPDHQCRTPDVQAPLPVTADGASVPHMGTAEREVPDYPAAIQLQTSRQPQLQKGVLPSVDDVPVVFRTLPHIPGLPGLDLQECGREDGRESKRCKVDGVTSPSEVQDAPSDGASVNAPLVRTWTAHGEPPVHTAERQNQLEQHAQFEQDIGSVHDVPIVSFPASPPLLIIQHDGDSVHVEPESWISRAREAEEDLCLRLFFGGVSTR